MSKQQCQFKMLAVLATLTGVLPIILLAFFKHHTHIPKHVVEIYLAMILVYITGVHWGFAYEASALPHLSFSLLTSLLPMLVLLLQFLNSWSTELTCLLLIGVLIMIIVCEHILPVTKNKKQFLKLRVNASLVLTAAIIVYLSV